MNAAEVEMGPIHYVVIEWPGRQPNGAVAGMEISELGEGVAEFAQFEG